MLIRSKLLALSVGLALATGSALAQDGWSGNFARNPGFEEDFVNLRGESHVLSFKGDWFYNQRDLIPDYWTLAGDWTWNDQAPHGDRKSLRLAAGATASQSFPGAVYQEGGSAWSGGESKPMTVTRPERLAQPWQATVWCRGGGTLLLGAVAVAQGGAHAPASGGDQWEKITVELPAVKVAKDASMIVTLLGPGEFDDLVVQEKLPNTPNLITNDGFELAGQDGHPAGWSKQKKFDWIGPTYYVWTDWMHFHSENRGRVGIDPLIVHGGRQSLRFDVYPGDEKFIESDFIALNQDQPHVIEVSAFVRADRIKMCDIRCVDEDGANLPTYYPVQPEYKTGGTALFGNGTFGWRYVRKYFATPFAEPVKGIKVRLAARGFNANTLDDAGTRSYACQTGTVWWDDLRVVERTSTAAELAARGVKLPAINAAAPAVTAGIAEADLDPGDRLYGENRLTLSLTNTGNPGAFRIRLTATLPGAQPTVSESQPLTLKTGARGKLEAPYRIAQLAGDLKQQGTLRVELFRDTAVVTDTTYAFNTWPCVVDFDVSRHYNLPEENPVTVALNFGVGAETLAQVARLELELKRPAENASLGTQTITDLKAAFAQTLTALPKAEKDSYEFKLPTPEWWTDRTNLLIVKLDLGPLRVWPHDNPTRDTVLEVRGRNQAGMVLFAETSDAFCRMAAPPKQSVIESVKIRDDGAVLINGQPRFLTGATHQHQRLTHDWPVMAQLGLMGHRLPTAKFEDLQKMWQTHGLYALQIKPGSGDEATKAYVNLPDEQKKALEALVKAGGMQSVVSINTGGWETHIPDTPEARAGHQKLNDWIRHVTQRPIAWSTSGAYNAWNISQFPYYDIVNAETEMWGPMDFNTIFTPYMKRLRKEPTTWVYLPQLYDNTPYDRYRFETYENIIRGSAGVSMIQGIGDATFNRGLAGELRYLEAPLNSREKAPNVTLEPNVSHLTRRSKGRTYILATNAGPIIIGDWKWNRETKQTGAASHEGDSVNRMWRRPAGLRLHGFRGLPLPELIQPGDKIVQYVWLDPQEKPDWVFVAVRGDGRFSHAGAMGGFDFAKFREEYGNVFMYSELNHSVWHEINYVMDPLTYDVAVKLMGKPWADDMKIGADKGRETVDRIAYQAGDFHKLGDLPAPGQWVRMEMSAEQHGLAGKLVDGFAYMTKNGRALWDYSALERGGKVVRVFCDDSVGIDRALLGKVRVSVPGLRAGASVRALFENRTLTAEAGGFSDNFEGVDSYGYEAGAVTGDLFGFVKDANRDLPRMMPSGYGYSYGPTAVHIYEIEE